MQANLNCNCPKPQFGMAVRKPQSQITKRLLSEYLNLDKRTNVRGWQQFIKEQDNLLAHDIKIDPLSKSFDVINNTTGKVVESFPSCATDITGLDHFGRVRFPGRKLFARIFNPKKFLPYNVYLAGEKAKALEKQTLKSIDMANRL